MNRFIIINVTKPLLISIDPGISSTNIEKNTSSSIHEIKSAFPDLSIKQFNNQQNNLESKISQSLPTTSSLFGLALQKKTDSPIP